MTENRVRSKEASGTLNAHAAEPSGASSASSTKLSGGPAARRSSRVPMVVRILLMGSDAEGRVFSEKTQTVVVSLHGAGILSRNKLYAEQVLYLREQATNREAEIRVVGEIGLQEGRYTYGVAFVDESLRFWRMDFPGGPASAEQPATLLLECSSCGQVAETANGDYEYDICAIHGGLARYCGTCGVLTVWRLTQKPLNVPAGAVVDAQQAMMVGAEAVAPVTEVEAGPAERRGRVRAKVNFSACVRTSDFGDDVVSCIDMSKGGVSFRGGRAYTKDMQVQIAVPFAGKESGVAPMFVQARIANVRELSNGVWRCGVEFLRP